MPGIRGRVPDRGFRDGVTSRAHREPSPPATAGRCVWVKPADSDDFEPMMDDEWHGTGG